MNKTERKYFAVGTAAKRLGLVGHKAVAYIEARTPHATPKTERKFHEIELSGRGKFAPKMNRQIDAQFFAFYGYVQGKPVQKGREKQR